MILPFFSDFSLLLLSYVSDKDVTGQKIIYTKSKFNGKIESQVVPVWFLGQILPNL